jgi:hypothetical protein
MRISHLFPKLWLQLLVSTEKLFGKLVRVLAERLNIFPVLYQICLQCCQFHPPANFTTQSIVLSTQSTLVGAWGRLTPVPLPSQVTLSLPEPFWNDPPLSGMA